ncbi:MAG TPA: sulfotransferase, partial [Burkholderiaceae bacterium]|nr:sulfotransferase [Burkholderiaceae bacterium]
MKASARATGGAAAEEQRLRTALAQSPRSARLHDKLGVVLARQRRYPEAAQLFERALLLDPTLPHTRRRLGDALAACGRGAEADRHYERFLEQDPDRKAIASGAEHLRAGRRPEAIAAFEAVLRREPDQIDAMRMLALAMMDDPARADDIEALLRRVTELAPDYVAAWNDLGDLYLKSRQWLKGADAFRAAARLEPRNAPSWAGLGDALSQAGCPEPAAEAYRRTIELNPTNAHAHMSLAHVLKDLGQQAQSIASYRGAIKRRPELGEAYWSLANLKTFRFSNEEIAAMEQQVGREGIPPASAVHFCFALGKAHEDRGDYDAAWQWYERGNQQQRPLQSHDPLIMEKRHTTIIDTFSAEFLRAHAGQGYVDARPIFIVGLHRSGSTLIEQILASHSQVEGTAELPNLGQIAASVGRYRSDRLGFPEAVRDLKPRDWRAYGRQYIDDTRRHRTTGKPSFTDKMPENFPLVGFLHLILPNACIIDARRHPLDSLLGNYKQLYGGGMVYSYDLEELAHYYVEYDRVMRHWQQVLPGKVLTVHYEDTVLDLEGQVRRILEHCGLAFEEACLRYHENPRTVRTASSEQVRRPIYTESLGAWR